MTYSTKSRVAALLYELMRDHVPFGVIERIVNQDQVGSEDGFELSNAHLGRYAEELARRLVPPPTPPASVEPETLPKDIRDLADMSGDDCAPLLRAFNGMQQAWGDETRRPTVTGMYSTRRGVCLYTFWPDRTNVTRVHHIHAETPRDCIQIEAEVRKNSEYKNAAFTYSLGR